MADVVEPRGDAHFVARLLQPPSVVGWPQPRASMVPGLNESVSTLDFLLSLMQGTVADSRRISEPCGLRANNEHSQTSTAPTASLAVHSHGKDDRCHAVAAALSQEL